MTTNSSIPDDESPATLSPSVSARINPVEHGREEKPMCRVCGLQIEMPMHAVRYSDSLSHWAHVHTAEGVVADRDHEALR
jgi:hypothetical protein